MMFFFAVVGIFTIIISVAYASIWMWSFWYRSVRKHGLRVGTLWVLVSHFGHWESSYKFGDPTPDYSYSSLRTPFKRFYYRMTWDGPERVYPVED